MVWNFSFIQVGLGFKKAEKHWAKEISILNKTKPSPPETSRGPWNEHGKAWPLSSSVTVTLHRRHKSCRAPQGYFARLLTHLYNFDVLSKIKEEKGLGGGGREAWCFWRSLYKIKWIEKKGKIKQRKAMFGQMLHSIHRDKPLVIQIALALDAPSLYPLLPLHGTPRALQDQVGQQI